MEGQGRKKAETSFYKLALMEQTNKKNQTNLY